MGGDGGVIAVQRRFLRACKEAQSEEDKEKPSREAMSDRASLCAISNQPFGDHIVACELGNLFNKEALIEGLLEKSVQRLFPHIKSLKDIKDCVFSKSTNADGKSTFICPLTRVEWNGVQPFAIIWTTGMVLSMKALREIPLSDLQADFGPFTDDDIIRLLPSEDELVVAKTQLENKRARRKKEKSKKRERESESIDQQEPRIDNKKDPGGDELLVVNAKKKLSKSEIIATTAAKLVEEQSSQSQAFKKLFHATGEADKTDRDLFMNVAGIRYTLR